jgi:hypothetical protein
MNLRLQIFRLDRLDDLSIRLGPISSAGVQAGHKKFNDATPVTISSYQFLEIAICILLGSSAKFLNSLRHGLQQS